AGAGRGGEPAPRPHPRGAAQRRCRVLRHRARALSQALKLGIDLGGTKIELATLDDAGAVRHRERIATPAGDYAATVEPVGRLVANADRALGERGTVGVATPGALSLATGRIKNANSTCLNGHALGEDLERRIGRAVRLANDADCFALSEAVDGAGR